jgi:hypothetical protein
LNMGNISRPINYGNSTLHPEWNSTLDADYYIVLAAEIMDRAKKDLICRKDPSKCDDRKNCYVFENCWECKASAEAYFNSTLFQNTLDAMGVDMSSSEYLRKRTDLGVYFD